MSPVDLETFAFWTGVSIWVLILGPLAVFLWFLRDVRSWFRNANIERTPRSPADPPVRPGDRRRQLI